MEMARIYRRSTLIRNTTSISKKNNRKRNLIMNFRVSPEEKEMIEKRISLSGMQKQEFFIHSCLHQKIVTYGNVKSFGEIREQIKVIDKHLLEVAEVDELDLEILESLRMILEILDGLDAKENE